MTNRLNWNAIEHGFSKRDQVLADNMAAYASLQITVPKDDKDKSQTKKAKTYKLTWEELSKYYLENEDKILPYLCEFGHDHCAVEPQGVCVSVAGLMMYVLCTETAVLQALYDEKIQTLLGCAKVNEFFERMKKFDKKIMPDLNEALFEAGYKQDLIHQYGNGSASFIELWTKLKGPCPLVRAKPEDYPDPPLKFYG